MSFDAWLKLANLIIIIASAVLNLVLYRKSQAEKLVKQINERIDEIDAEATTEATKNSGRWGDLHTRLSVLEERGKHAPTQEDLNEIRDQMAEHGQMLATVDERSKATLASVQRVETFLLDRKL